MPRLRAGSLRLRLEIQTFTVTYNSIGEPIRTWATQATRWGSLMQTVGGEQEVFRQPEASATYKLTLRDYPTLSPLNRIKYGSRIFHIHTVNQEMESNHVTSALVTEEVA